MTRYARAHGSKSSNERLPEEATSWHVMKQQLEEKQKSSDRQRVQKKKESKKFYFDFTGNSTSEWATFEKPENLNHDVSKKKTKKRKNSIEQGNITNECTVENKSAISSSDLSEQKVVKKKKQKLKQENNPQSDYTNNFIETVPSEKLDEEKQKIKRRDKLHKFTAQNNKAKKKDKIKKLTKKQLKKTFDEIPIEGGENWDDGETVENNILQKKEKRIKKKKLKSLEDTVTITSAHEIQKENTKLQQKRERKKKQKNRENKQVSETDKTGFKGNNFRNGGMKREMKQKWDKLNARRKPENSPYKMFINGKEIEIVHFSGFPVKKEDAERLRELQKKMRAQKIPKEEMAVTMKLERRKAEKALSREKKRVCFHCRKSGHNLSECPELGTSSSSGTGICFKCGSTEHTHFQCKVVHGQDFRYAECFICKEQGHIARQCPDNPRGLYPKGGACNVCGDVTHMKKDCPDLIAQKEGETITLGTLNNSSLEVLDEDLQNVKSEVSDKKISKKKKLVKF